MLNSLKRARVSGMKGRPVEAKNNEVPAKGRRFSISFDIQEAIRSSPDMNFGFATTDLQAIRGLCYHRLGFLRIMHLVFGTFCANSWERIATKVPPAAKL